MMKPLGWLLEIYGNILIDINIYIWIVSSKHILNNNSWHKSIFFGKIRPVFQEQLEYVGQSYALF